MKRSKFVATLLLFVCLFSPAEAYNFPSTRKESPQEFNSFLDSCTQEELNQMFRALRGDSGVHVTPSEIRKQLVWRAYNKTTYMFRGDKEVDYHGIVQWVADNSDIPSNRVKNAPTYALEKEIAEIYFAKIWEEMSPEQRKELIDNIVKTEGEKFTANISFPDERTLMELQSMIFTNPEAALAVAGGVYAVLTWLGPLGWAAMAAGGVWMAGSEVDTVSAFIMTVNLIKTRRYVK